MDAALAELVRPEHWSVLRQSALPVFSELSRGAEECHIHAGCEATKKYFCDEIADEEGKAIRSPPTLQSWAKDDHFGVSLEPN